ncbi:unnamed protein product [Sphagnum troendelagicum]
MEANCCSSGCFRFGRRRNARTDPDNKPATGTGATVFKRFSRERSLGFTLEDVNNKASHKAGRQAAKSPLTQYCPPCDDRPTATTVVVGLADSKQHPIKELRGGPAKVSDFCAHHQPLRKMTVKETHHVVRSEDFDGNKMINEYVRESKIGTGSYGKVVLHRSKRDNRLYAIKIFHKSRLCKLRVSPTETAMMDVLREVAIMKQLDHPNIVKLVEVIDDPESDHFYMVLEYVEGGWIFEGSGPPGGLREATARRYFSDVVAGLIYLHGLNIVHGDIKPENLLISGDGCIKICDFGVSRACEGGNDELRRSPGTPVYTAPECCLGLTYHGKPADVWALGCTLYCMILGHYPFVGDTLQSTYEKIVNDPLYLPMDLSADLADLLKGLLCKDVQQRLTLEAAATHPWVLQGYGALQQESQNGQHYQLSKVTNSPVPFGMHENGSVA